MKRVIIAAGAVISFFLLSVSNAAAVVIADGYHGGTPNNAAFLNQDIVGDPQYWETTQMEVLFDPNGSDADILTVIITSTYFDNVGRNGGELGDLFISTDGWNPFGAAPYNNDTYLNGEDWELVAVLDDHGEGVSDTVNGENYTGQSGALAIYDVNQANILLSRSDGGSGDFREFQEVQYAAANDDALSTGGWQIIDVPGSDFDNLVLTLMLPDGSFDRFLDWGFHWTMTCGNDVIEGNAPIPEPGTLLLMGAGLMGALPWRRKRKRA